MGVNAPDVNLLGREEDHGNQPVVVALDVKHVAALADVVRRGKVGQQVVVARPGAELHLRKPDFQGFPRLGVLAAVAIDAVRVLLLRPKVTPLLLAKLISPVRFVLPAAMIPWILLCVCTD